MTVETPQLSDASPTTDAVRVKRAGEGVAEIQNPYESFSPSGFSQEQGGAEAGAASDAVKTKDVGEGAVKVKDPYGSFKLQSFSQEEWDLKLKVQKDTAAPAGGATSATAGKGAAKLIERAKQFIGTPYKWGGSGPLGFDCSGFTQFLYREMGIDLPRISAQQAASGPRISLDKLRPGDLVAWDNSSRNNGADHIAIYIGDGKVIQAPKPGDAVKISTIWDSGHAWGVAMNL